MEQKNEEIIKENIRQQILSELKELDTRMVSDMEDTYRLGKHFTHLIYIMCGLSVVLVALLITSKSYVAAVIWCGSFAVSVNAAVKSRKADIEMLKSIERLKERIYNEYI